MSGVNADGYTPEQQLHLNAAKRKHRETTESAQRALQVRTRRRDVQGVVRSMRSFRTAPSSELLNALQANS